MKINKIILIIISLLVVVAIAYISFSKKDYPAEPQGKLPSGTELDTFSGTIESVDTGCFVDATCSVTVFGKKVVIESGRMVSGPRTVGRLLGVDSISDIEKHIGDHANVYAAPTAENEYTLYGDEKYYVEVVEVK